LNNHQKIRQTVGASPTQSPHILLLLLVAGGSAPRLPLCPLIQTLLNTLFPYFNICCRFLSQCWQSYHACSKNLPKNDYIYSFEQKIWRHYMWRHFRPSPKFFSGCTTVQVCTSLEHGRRQRGARGVVAPLDFPTWYKYSRRLKSAIFGLFCYFSVFFSVALPPHRRGQI